MAITILTKDNYDNITNQEGIVMVDCWAEWCAACASFNPIYERVSEKYPNHTFAKLDAAAEKKIISDLGVEHIPTLLLYRDGILLFQQAGYYEEDKLKDIVSQAENLDMDEVRAHIEREQNEQNKSNDSN